MKPAETLILMIKMARPHFLVGGLLLFALGVGIARYLGTPIDWGVYISGQVWITLMQLSTHFLNEYFNAPADIANKNRTPFSGGSGALGPGKLPRSLALWAGAVSLAGVATTTVLLIQQGALFPTAVLVMALIFFGAFFYAVPPVRLEASGYGELTTSILVASLVPAFGLLLQFGDLHRLLMMATLPLTFLHLAMLLAFELPDYANDLKFEKRTMMVRLGWERGMLMHNAAVMAAYLFLGVALMFNMPLTVAGPVLLTLPLGALQIWNMNRIAGGGKPNWTMLTLMALLAFALPAYLFAYSFWTL
jgi:1,4-dihydroxy-2-naphthoate polyprenyltransferase